MNATAEQRLRAGELLYLAYEFFHEFVAVIRPPVGHFALDVIPYALVRVEFRRVGWKELDMEPGKTVAQILDRGPLVNGAVVQQGNHVTTEVSKEVTQELTHLGLFDVALIEMTIQPKMFSLWAYRYPRDGRDFVALVAMAMDRRTASRRPGFSDIGNQQESGFVNKDDVGTQPRSVFLSGANPCVSNARSPAHCVPWRAVRVSGGSSLARA